MDEQHQDMPQEDAPPAQEGQGAPEAPQIPDAMAAMIEAAPTSAMAAEPEFGDLGDPMASGDPGSLSMLYELTMPVAIELGRTRMSVQEILGLGRGSVIQLERLAGEPIDVFVGDRRFAEGEVVVVGEQFGVRVTRILKPTGAVTEGAQA